MDEVASYNARRWNTLVGANALFTRPWLDLDRDNPLDRVDPGGRYGDVRGKHVLCLASGGGQQSAAFSLAGAHVAVVDLSAGQIERDREAARHFGYEVEALSGDMRDLSMFDSGRFDIIYHPYSINFVPDCGDVFGQVARVIRPGGTYMFMAANPFAAGLGTHSWNGRAFELGGLYEQGAVITYGDEAWVFPEGDTPPPVQPVREHRHLLSTLIDGLVENGFVVRHIEEALPTWHVDEHEPGGWTHFMATIPPWLTFFTVKAADAKM